MNRRMFAYLWVLCAVSGCGKGPGGSTPRGTPPEPPIRREPEPAHPALKPNPPDEADKPYSFRSVPLPTGVGIYAPVTFSSDGKRMAGGGNGAIHVMTVPDGKEVIQMQLPNKEPAFVAFADEGKSLFSVSATDKMIRAWSLTTGKQVSECALPRANELGWVIGFSPGGQYLALKLKTGIVLVDPQSGKVVGEFEGAGPGDLSPAEKFLGGGFSPDGKRFAARQGDGRFAVWECASGKRLVQSREKLPGGRGDFTFLSFSPDGKRLATSVGLASAGSIQIWDAMTGELRGELARPVSSMLGGFAWMPDSKSLVRRESNVVAVDVATGKIVHEFKPNSWLGGMVGATPDSRYFVFNSPVNYTNFALVFCRLPEWKKPKDPE